MMLKIASVVTAALALSGPALGVTVNVTDFTFGPAPGVIAKGTASYTGRAGQFTGEYVQSKLKALDFATIEVAKSGAPTFIAYCAELTQSFFFNVDYDYTPMSGASYFTPEKLTDLSRLFTATAGFVTDKYTSAAMQSAIWEVIYQPGRNYDLDSGAFEVQAQNPGDLLTNDALKAVNAYLLTLSSYSASADISVLTNPKNQDFIIGSIPEPGTWALMAGGLFAVGALARRRKPANQGAG